MSIKSYVNPESLAPRSSLSQLRSPRDELAPVRVTLSFLTNGKPNPRATKEAMTKILWHLQASGQFASVESGGSPGCARMEIQIDNVGDVGDAVAEGLKAGVSLGASGGGVTDGYVFIGAFRPAAGPSVTKTYRHALYTTVGNKAGPKGLPAMSMQGAFYRVVEDLVDNFLRDLQVEGAL